MDWLSVLDLVVSWLSSILDFSFSFFSRFPSYLPLIVLLTFVYFTVQKLLQPIFDGHLPEGSLTLHSELKRYQDSQVNKR